MTPEERATALCVALTEECVAWYDGFHATNELRDRIAAEIRAAIAEERERCAKVIEAHRLPMYANGVLNDLLETWRETAAAAICKGA